MCDAFDALQHMPLELKMMNPAQTMLVNKLLFPSPYWLCTLDERHTGARKTNEKIKRRTNDKEKR
jgi:hypothetical protein